MAVRDTPLSRERILRAAIEVADREGLDSASLRKVASELGVHVTSLYNHIATKEALLDGIVEELFARADLPIGEVPWDQWLRSFIEAVAWLAREHPGAFAVFLRRPVQGPEATATFEAGLAAFHREGMTARDSYAVVKSVTLAILGVCVEQAYAAGHTEVVSTDLTRLPAESFPVLLEATRDPEEVDVVAALSDILVAGLAARLPLSLT